ncbi:Uncharacterised protein [Mycobacteroides abscessus]|nr:Uncharacterised protein [Mycobacteroides abscessus]
MNDVVSHRPNDHAGTRAGRPVSAVYRRSTSLGVGPWMTRYSSDCPSTENWTRVFTSEATSNETFSGCSTNTP